jgi:hypothetical protein
LSSFTKHHAENTVSLRTKGHSNSDLRCALRHGIGDNGVSSKRREKQCEAGKRAQQHHGKALLSHGIRHDVAHGGEIVDGFSGIRPGNRRMQLRQQR